MRLFVGVGIGDEVRRSLASVVERLRARARVRWSAVEGLHVTLKFIGDWPDDGVDDVHGALAEIARSAFDVRVRGVGWFPGARAPRVFWIGVESDALSELATRVERALVPLGVAAETRSFTPHLTLARIRPGTPLDDLRRAIDDLPSTDFGRFRAESFGLYESRNGYHVIRRYALA
jgi:2'-5' RNA ligase